MLAATPAFGQATRTWVSGVGDDVNPCSRTAPCKTFSGAISKTATGGEISVLDPGGFGGVTINKSLTIDGLAQMSSILAVGQNGITVNGAAAVVNIRNITINCANSTIGNGIRIINAASVTIEHVVIENCAGTGTNGRGIVIETAADVRVVVSNTEIRNNFNIGIHSNPTAGNVTLIVDNVRVSGGDFSSIQLRQNTTATINRATLTNSRLGGGLTTELTSVNATVTNSVLASNAHGIFNGSGGNPTVVVSGTTITRNTTSGITNNSGSVISLGNNTIRGNVGNEAPTQTVPTT
jgi:hypothetical protein